MAASFLSTKGFSNKTSMDCSNIAALVLHNTSRRCVFKCDCAKKLVVSHNVLEKRIQDTTGGALITDNANFLQRLWRTLVFGRVQRVVCLKRRTLRSKSKATPPANPILLLCCLCFNGGLNMVILFIFSLCCDMRNNSLSQYCLCSELNLLSFETLLIVSSVGRSVVRASYIYIYLLYFIPSF